MCRSPVGVEEPRAALDCDCGLVQVFGEDRLRFRSGQEDQVRAAESAISMFAQPHRRDPEADEHMSRERS
jgi:hypothetical protein